jgi:hypothetical protein
VIADAAYPDQVGEGMRSFVAGSDHFKVIENVLQAIDRAEHIKPTIFLDAELAHLDELDCPGATDVRRRLDSVLSNRAVSMDLHERILTSLDEASRLYRVLVVKTPMLIPYTSVFIRLDCGYWSDDAEHRLRGRMAVS